MGNGTQPPRSRMGGLFAGGGALAGLATLLGASCCILPLVFAQVGLGAALASQLSFLSHAKPYLLAVTVALIAAALIASFWKGRRPRPIVLAMLAGALVLIALSEILPHYEGQLIRWIGY